MESKFYLAKDNFALGLLEPIVLWQEGECSVCILLISYLSSMHSSLRFKCKTREKASFDCIENSIVFVGLMLEQRCPAKGHNPVLESRRLEPQIWKEISCGSFHS